MTRHRFRPRYRGVAWSAIGIGGSVATVAAAIGFVAAPFVTGAIGVVFATAYLASPTWRLEVVVDDQGLTVRDRKRTRFALAWTDIVRVVASPSTHTCFVDGGAPEKSLLVPGDGAPAPYALEDRDTLFATILAHVTPGRIETVETLDAVSSTKTPA